MATAFAFTDRAAPFRPVTTAKRNSVSSARTNRGAPRSQPFLVSFDNQLQPVPLREVGPPVCLPCAASRGEPTGGVVQWPRLFRPTM